MIDQELYQLIGRRLRARRRLLEMTQSDVASACGTTFQQIHKHETGAGTLSVARLLKLAQVLRTPVAELIEPANNRTGLAARDPKHPAP